MRIAPADVPVHIIQRGNNRSPTFREPPDYIRYCMILNDARRRTGCAIHAYVLMTNHVHLLVTPTRTMAVSKLMQVVAARYVRYFNDRYRRTGTLWEGRFRSASIDSERYFFSCARYIELNPVRAGIAGHPGEYQWSSFSANAEGRVDALLEPHPLYRALGRGRRERASAYATLFAAPAEDQDSAVRVIRRATASGRPVAGSEFIL